MVTPPRFRSRKDNRQAIRFTANARFRVLDNGWLRLPKIGDVPVRWSRNLPADPSSVTIVKDARTAAAALDHLTSSFVRHEYLWRAPAGGASVALREAPMSRSDQAVVLSRAQ